MLKSLRQIEADKKHGIKCCPDTFHGRIVVHPGYRKNDVINNPRTGNPIFAHFPCINYRGHVFPNAPIFLRFGDRRFGVAHIWQEHRRDIPALSNIALLDHEAVVQIAHYVSRILGMGGDIYCEFADMRGNHRPLVFRSGAGLVVLEQKQDGAGQALYSVVTAFPGKIKGTKIGALSVLGS